MSPAETSLLAITETALERVRAFLAQAPEGQAMWVEVAAPANGEYTYAMALKPLASAKSGDAVQRVSELDVVVPEASVSKLRGATIDWAGDTAAGGLSVLNPNKPPAPPPPSLPMAAPSSPAVGVRPPADLSGDVAQRVIAVLEREINPAIAEHGGRAELVAVEEDRVYLRLGGGCQGCGMASVTLNQGIKVAVMEGVPEIREVIDVTDHASGANPYFESAKK